MHAERNAIGRRAVDAMRFEAVEVNTFKAQWSRCRDRMSHRRLLHIGRDDAHLSEPPMISDTNLAKEDQYGSCTGTCGGFGPDAFTILPNNNGEVKFVLSYTMPIDL